MKIKKDVSELQIGMHVSDLDRPWIESSFTFQGFEITSDKILSDLQKECSFVYIDTEKSYGAAKSLTHDNDSGTKSKGLEFVDTVIMNINDLYDENVGKEISKGKALHDKTCEYVDGIFKVLNKGGQLDIDSVKVVVSELVESIISNPDTMIWLSHLKDKDEYTAIHSVNVCILALTFGRTLGLSEIELNELGIGALLFDIGKSKIPDNILKKTDSLTDDEFLLMKAHAFLGYATLEENKEVPQASLEIILNHHERLNGKGYPNGRRADEISMLTRVVSIVDVFDAMTSDRCYQDAFQAQHALNELYNMSPDELDQDLVEGFIKCIGIYPVGSIVELNTGHTGVIVKLNAKNRLKPIVGLALNRNKEPYETIKMLNLSSDVWQKSSGTKVEIVKILEPHAHNINVKSIIKKLSEF